MTVFNHYAQYYDLLYRDKDYAGEAQYVAGLIEHFRPGSQSILEFGCGTGRHAVEFSKLGYHVHGIDISPEMIRRAQALFASLPGAQLEKLSCEVGDVRCLRLPVRYDAVVSLFHVMSYQLTNRDISASIESACFNLKEDGVLIFDCWYGPAVLTDPPVVRVKVLEDQQVKITRIAEPVINSDRNTVDVNYRVIITDKHTHFTNEIVETHVVRYWFQPEVEELLELIRFKPISCNAWLSDQPANLNSWNVVFVAKRI